MSTASHDIYYIVCYVTRFGVAVPTLYATTAELEDEGKRKEYNSIQRAHQNSLEYQPAFLSMLLATSLQVVLLHWFMLIDLLCTNKLLGCDGEWRLWSCTCNCLCCVSEKASFVSVYAVYWLLCWLFIYIVVCIVTWYLTIY